MSTAYSLDKDKADQLKANFLSTLAEFHDIDEDQVHREIEDAEAQAQSFFDDIMNNDADNMNEPDMNAETCEGFNRDIFEEDNPFDETIKQAFEEFKQYIESQKTPEPKKLDEKWIKGIFRKAANALHPDKEQDPAKREEKQQLMSELLKARDENDVLTLMGLYHAHVSEEALSINEDSLQSLCDQLQNQLVRLEHEKEQMTSGYDNPIYGIVYNNLFGKTKSQQSKAIGDYIEQLEAEKQGYEEMVASLRNLKVLKLHLEDRYEERRYQSPFGF